MRWKNTVMVAHRVGPLTWTLSRRVRKRLLENMIPNVKPEDEQKLSGDLCVGED